MARWWMILLLVVTLRASAQDVKDSSLWKPYSVQQFGVLIGENNTSYTLNFIGGVQYRQAKAGVGLGVNGYIIRSMPLYLDLRYDIGKRKTRLMTFVCGGFNLFPGYSNNNYYYYSSQIIKKLTGTYAEAGIGFKTKLGGDLFYNTSFSYMYKKSRFIQDGNIYWNGTTWVTDASENVTVESGMVALKVGLDF